MHFSSLLPPYQATKSLYHSEQFYSLAQIQQLEACIHAIRQGHSLTTILSEFQQRGSIEPLVHRMRNSRFAKKKPSDSPTDTKVDLPTHLRKPLTPVTHTKKVIPPVKSLYASAQPFPILKKRNSPPVEWFTPS
jgi:hypothetical protein